MDRILKRGLLVFTLAVCAWYFIAWGKAAYPFNGDAMGYYMYLPSTFIYHNHKALDWLPENKDFDYRVRYYVDEIRREGAWTPKGYLIDKYTYGVAALELPFFFAAHAYEKITGGNADGYSAAYANMVKLSSLVYALLGLLLLYKILEHFFGSTLSVVGTAVVLLGTNLFWFALHQAGMAHVPLFFLYALLIYTTILLHRRPRMLLFIIAGLAAGLITIIRPTDIICLLIPLLYDVYNKETLLQKVSFFKQQAKGIVAFASVFVLPLIPQMLYWKKFAGSFLYYSYKNEKFNWAEPRIWEGLFSFKNGWFIYTPLMLFAVLGLVFYRRIRPVAMLTWLMLPAYIYIVYCWHCYNYINGLGSRPMIHLYPLLAIPLTALIQFVSEKSFFLKAITCLVFVFCISLNISYSLQQARNILFSEESNATYNLHMLFRMNATYREMVMHDVEQVQPDNNNVERLATLACSYHEDSTSADHVPDPTGKSRFVFHMKGGQEYYPEQLKVKYNKAVFKDAQWFRCSGIFCCPQHYSYFKHLFTLDIKSRSQQGLWWGCRIDNKIGLAEPDALPREFTFNHCELNRWGQVWYYIRIPQGLEDGDEIRLDIWNIGHQDIFFDNICLELYKDKPAKRN